MSPGLKMALRLPCFLRPATCEGTSDETESGRLGSGQSSAIRRLQAVSVDGTTEYDSPLSRGPSSLTMILGRQLRPCIGRSSSPTPGVTQPIHYETRGRPVTSPTKRSGVAYDRQTINTPNPLARFAHRRRTSVAVEAAIRWLPDRGLLFDFGCGPGDYLERVKAARPDLELIGFDPYAQLLETITVLSDTEAIPNSSVDVMTSLEVCEHLSDSNLSEMINLARRVLRPTGVFIVSVPIIAGPGLLAKEVNRYALHRNHSDYTAKELAAAALLGRPARRPDNVQNTHKGFDFKALRHRVSTEMQPVQHWYSPFPRLPWFANSQAFDVWKV